MTPLRLPEDWSAEQAMLALDLLEALHQAIWDAHEEPLVAILRKQLDEEPVIDRMEQAERSGQGAFDFDLDDHIPF